MTVGKTVPELTAETPPIVGTDEVVVYRSPGPLKRTTAATVRTYMQSNLGTMATQNANAVAITGGSITGITDLAVADGGTGASDASGARTNLGLVIGTNVQAYDADLQAIAALTSAADKMPYATGAQTWALADLTSFARTLNATANQSAFLAAFGQIDLVETDFVQAGTGATAVTGQAKLRQASVQPNSGEFGAFTNATVTTATLLAAFTAAMSLGRVVELAGHYDINGPITPVSAVDGAELRIFLRDDVTITVDAGSTAFNRVFYAESTTVKSHSVSGGGSLTLNCNNKAAVGFWLRHAAATTGGEVLFNAPVTVRNLTAATTITNAAGIIVLGRYERIIMRSPTVEDVTRVDVSGECSGITCSGFDGEVEMYSPVVRRVYFGPGSADADCIKCFGRQGGGANERREGSVRIYSPIMEDGEVRLYKDQCGDTIIYSPWGRRRAVDGVAGSFAASGSVDFDFQFGGGVVLDAHLEYYKSATSVSPLGSSHSTFAFQQLINNAEMYASAKDTTIITDVEIPRIVLSATSSTAKACATKIDGLTILPASGFTSSVIGRGIVEFNASQAVTKSATTLISVNNTRAPTTFPVIAYTGYASTDSGTATAGAATTLTDSSKAWTANVYAGFLVRITSGTGAGQTKAISSNTATALTVVSAWTVNPDATSVYSIWYSAASMRLDNGTATAGAATTLTDSSKSWVTNQWANQLVRIATGTGFGQVRTIASNTATVLTVTESWTTTPDATSVYLIVSVPRLSLVVNNCATSLPSTGNATTAVSEISGDPIRYFEAFEIGDNPGYRNWYRRLSFCPKLMRSGAKISLFLDDCLFLDTDYSTPVSVPWGTTGTLALKCDGLTNTNTVSNDAVIVAYLNAASPNSWFTMDGGLNWRTGN